MQKAPSAQGPAWGPAAGSGRRRPSLGQPRLHQRPTDSTNTRARELAERGAPHGTLVTAAEQLSGRGRQGRVWAAPAGRALLCSVIVREPPRLAPLAAGVAVAELVDELVPEQRTHIKWPNDVLVNARKVAGILVEARPREQWAVVGIGVNVALGPEDLPAELRERAGTLALAVAAIEPALARLMELLGDWIGASDQDVLTAVRARDALRGHRVRWGDGEGIAAGIDDDGLLLVTLERGQVALDAGEVHLAG